jgi:o-succinylbenzoate synthase
MNLTAADIYSYALPLKHPLNIKGHPHLLREGFILHLKSSDGKEGFGEIAPLEGFSDETLDEALKQIQSFRHFLLSENIPTSLEKLDNGFERWLGAYNLKPSVRFGIEMAILNLTAQSRQKTLSKLISDSHRDSDTHRDQVRVSGLLQGSQAEILKELRQLLKDGYRSFKMKVGEDLKEDILKVQAVITEMNGQALLHVDANQSWTISQAIQFTDEVGITVIEYIEEPFAKADSIPEFVNKTTVPVAMDESLSGLHFDDIKSIEGVDYLILKPSFIGSIEKTYALIKEAKRLALSPIISSLFESGLGILTLANLAGLTSRDLFAGIDTLKWFKDDLLLEPLVTYHGRLDISRRTIQSKDINFKLLKKVAA